MKILVRMRLLAGGLALIVALAQAQSSMVLKRSFWSGPQPESPRLPVEGVSLDFVLRPATAAGKTTLALLAAGRLPGSIAEAYGARAEGATQIVAVDSTTGAVYSRPAEREGTAPLAAVSASHRKAPHSAGATVDSIEVWFNADLRSHLDLPPAAQTYNVFLWLDEITSPLRVAQLPSSGGSSTPPTSPAPPEVAGSGIHFRKSSLSPRAPAHGLILHAGSSPSHTIVHGSVSLLGLSSPNVILTVLALDSHTRELSWKNFSLDSRDLKTSGGDFDFDPATLFKIEKKGDSKVFVAAVIHQSLSNIVTIQ